MQPFDKINENKSDLVIDIEPPVISHRFYGNQYFTRDTLFITSKTKIDLKAVDNGAGVDKIEYTVNDSENILYTDQFTISDEGIFDVQYSAYGHVGNMRSSQFIVVVDNTGPVIEKVLSMETTGSIKLDKYESPLSVYTQGTKFFLGATDKKTDTKEIYYTINDGKEFLYVTPIVIEKRGVNTIEIRATDKLLNQTKSETIFVYIN